MSKYDNWNSLGDVRELERKAKKIQDIKDMAEWGRLTLKLVADMDYLNGCVKRGRGSDIVSNCPAQNVFEYIKELEAQLTAAQGEVEILKSALQAFGSNEKYDLLQQLSRCQAELQTYRDGVRVEGVLKQSLSMFPSDYELDCTEPCLSQFVGQRVTVIVLPKEGE